MINPRIQCPRCKYPHQLYTIDKITRRINRAFQNAKKYSYYLGDIDKLIESISIDSCISYKCMAMNYDNETKQIAEYEKEKEFMKRMEIKLNIYYSKRCKVCSILTNITIKDYIFPKKHLHHISYDPEIIIPVCEPCHYKIHHLNESPYKEYKPTQKRKILIQKRGW